MRMRAVIHADPFWALARGDVHPRFMSWLCACEDVPLATCLLSDVPFVAVGTHGGAKPKAEAAAVRLLVAALGVGSVCGSWVGVGVGSVWELGFQFSSSGVTSLCAVA